MTDDTNRAGHASFGPDQSENRTIPSMPPFRWELRIRNSSSCKNSAVRPRICYHRLRRPRNNCSVRWTVLFAKTLHPTKMTILAIKPANPSRKISMRITSPIQNVTVFFKMVMSSHDFLQFNDLFSISAQDFYQTRSISEASERRSVSAFQSVSCWFTNWGKRWPSWPPY